MKLYESLKEKLIDFKKIFNILKIFFLRFIYTCFHRYDWCRLSSEKYGTYRPPVKDASKIYSNICLLGEGGIFRISFAGKEPIRIKLKSELLFNGEDLFPGFSVELSVHPDELQFQVFN